MNTTHTPGPWEYAGTTVFALTTDKGRHAVNRFFAGVQSAGQEHEATVSECMSNARLIAAAPDLLSALQGVLRVADRKTDEFDAARAAIAKAVGAV